MHDNITYSELNCIRVTVSGPLTWRHRQGRWPDATGSSLRRWANSRPPLSAVLSSTNERHPGKNNAL